MWWLHLCAVHDEACGALGPGNPQQTTLQYLLSTYFATVAACAVHVSPVAADASAAKILPVPKSLLLLLQPRKTLLLHRTAVRTQ